MTNLQAALGLAQLERLDEFVARKRRMGARYTELLSGLLGIQLPLARTDYAENIYWVYGVVLDASNPFDAVEAMQRLVKSGVGTRPFFWPLHEQPIFQQKGWFKKEDFPVASAIARRGFYIPSGLGLSNEQLGRVGSVLEGCLQ